MTVEQSRRPHALLGSLRPTASGTVAGAVVVVAVGAVRYRGQTSAGRVDERAERLLLSLTTGHRSLLDDLTSFGSPLVVVLWSLGMALVCAAARRWRFAVLALVGPGVTGLTTTLLKPLVGRVMDGGGYAYPSGHTAGATALALVAALALVSCSGVGRPARITVLTAGSMAIGGAVGVGMVVIGTHYPTDAVGGGAVAIAMVLGSAAVIDSVSDRRTSRGRTGAGGGDPGSPI